MSSNLDKCLRLLEPRFGRPGAQRSRTYSEFPEALDRVAMASAQESL